MKMINNLKEKNEKAITLIALVITIIVLLILAGVTVATLTGENGLLNKASTAREKNKEAEQDEKNKLSLYEKEIDNYQTWERTGGEETDELKQKVLNMVYPVGSIYIGTTNVNPSSFIGGTWEVYGEGRTIVGAGTATDDNNESKTFVANSTGGEYNHQLTVEEMPSHSHTANYNGIYMKERNDWGYHVPDTYAALKSEQTLTTSEEGGSESHNNIQPYIVTYMWKRVN